MNAWTLGTSVETNAQLLRAEKSSFSSVIAVPIAQRPLPGGKNFMLYILSYMLSACCILTSSFHGNPFLKQCLICMVNAPLMTRSVVSCHFSCLPNSSEYLAYDLKYAICPRPLNPKLGYWNKLFCGLYYSTNLFPKENFMSGWVLNLLIWKKMWFRALVTFLLLLTFLSII